MPDENDKHNGPKAPAQNAPGPSNPRPNHAPQEGNPLAGPQQNPLAGPQQNPSQNPAQNPGSGLQWAQTSQSPDLFSSVPGYQPHSFGQPVTQPVVNTSFAQEQLASLAAQSGAVPNHPQGFGEPIIEPTAQPISPAYGQPQPGLMPQQNSQQAQIPHPGLVHQPGQIPHPGLIAQQLLQPGYPNQSPPMPQATYQPQPAPLPQQMSQPGYQPQPAPVLPAPSAEIPQLKLPPKPPSQQKPMSQMLPYQYQYQSQQGPQEPQLAPQYTPQRSPQFLNQEQNPNQGQNQGQAQAQAQGQVQTQGQAQAHGQAQNQPQSQPYNYSQDNTLNQPPNNDAQNAANAQALALKNQQAQVWQKAQQQWQLQPKSAEQLAQEQAARSAQSLNPNQINNQNQAQYPNQAQYQNQAQNPNQVQGQGQASGVRPQQQQYQLTPRAVSTNYAGSDAGRAPNMAGQYESKDFVPKTPPVISTGQDPNKPWASSSEPQFELFAEEYEEAIRFAQKAREQTQNVAPAKPSVWQEKLAEAAAATEVPVPKVLPTVQSAAGTKGTAGQPGSHQSALSDALDTVAQPQLSRGAAALRAAGMYNKGNSSRQTEEPIASSFKISKQDILGLIAYNLLIAKTICTDPRGFFAKMPHEGPMAEPLIFLLVIEIIASLARCVTSFSLKPLFADLIMSLIATILGAVLVSLAFDKMGGKGNFNSTLRVLCFSKAPILIAFLGIAQFQLGALVALGYGTYLNYVGLSKTQKLDLKTTVAIIVVMGILGALFRGSAP